MMVLVSTMNVNRALPTKVAAVAATFFATGSQVMALQKVGVNAACVVSTVAAFRAHGLRLSLGSFDGACHRTGLLSCVQGRQVTLPSIKHQSRYTAAVFEFSGAAGYTKVLVASTYGQASGPEEATFAVASDLAASGHSWVMVDGFNVGMEEDPMCRRRSELNYGWASFDMPATSVQCFATGC